MTFPNYHDLKFCNHCNDYFRNQHYSLGILLTCKCSTFTFHDFTGCFKSSTEYHLRSIKRSIQSQDEIYLIDCDVKDSQILSCYIVLFSNGKKIQISISKNIFNSIPILEDQDKVIRFIKTARVLI